MAVSGLGRTETCITHHDRSAAARCGRCHKPICEECVISTSDGKFCTRVCAEKAADFRAASGKMKQKKNVLGGLVKKIVWLVILIAALALVNRAVYRIPVIGGLLDKVPVIGKDAEPIKVPELPGSGGGETAPPSESGGE